MHASEEGEDRRQREEEREEYEEEEQEEDEEEEEEEDDEDDDDDDYDDSKDEEYIDQPRGGLYRSKSKTRPKMRSTRKAKSTGQLRELAAGQNGALGGEQGVREGIYWNASGGGGAASNFERGRGGGGGPMRGGRKRALTITGPAGKKRFQCELCGNSFSTSGHLAR